jgi:D-alanyl-D-alanine carboxypeptidase (penicillin-binding protein 5/6)
MRGFLVLFSKYLPELRRGYMQDIHLLIIRKCHIPLWFFCVFISVFSANPISAATPKDLTHKSAILIEAETGHVLKAYRPNAQHMPASIVKMMLMLLLAEGVERGALSLDEEVTTSAEASRMGGSQVFLKHGEQFPLSALMKALTIASANDAALAIAEHIAGASDAMVSLMNQRAQELGMKNTHYASVHGLPPGPDKKYDYTTAYDTALLAREIVKHPLILKWTRIWKDKFRGGKFTLYNTNRILLRTFNGMDGIKTGYLKEAGFNICATAVRDEMRLIAVVFGAPSRKERTSQTRKLLLQGFRVYKKEKLFAAIEEISRTLPVEGGEKKTVLGIPARQVMVVVKRLKTLKITTRLQVPLPIKAPIQKGEKLGEIEALLGSKVLAKVDLLAAESVSEMGWLGRLMFWNR